MGLIQNVTMENVHVCRNITVIHTSVADLNVLLVRIVQETKFVLPKNVSTLVQICVVEMLYVMFSITYQCAVALLDLQAILLYLATPLKVSSNV